MASKLVKKYAEQGKKKRSGTHSKNASRGQNKYKKKNRGQGK